MSRVNLSPIDLSQLENTNTTFGQKEEKLQEQQEDLEAVKNMAGEAAWICVKKVLFIE